jgi:hypothetical protein
MLNLHLLQPTLATQEKRRMSSFSSHRREGLRGFSLYLRELKRGLVAHGLPCDAELLSELPALPAGYSGTPQSEKSKIWCNIRQ